MKSISVVIASFRRPADLRRCLEGLALSTRFPDEIIVVLRREDDEGRRVAADRDARIVDVKAPGHLPPLIAGLEAHRGDVMAILDDDAVPRRDWLQRIEDDFRNPDVVAVGGPLNESSYSLDSDAGAVRRLRGRARRWRTWYGGLEGLPCLADYVEGSSSEIAPADHLTGANLSVRSAVMRRVGFDTAMNEGAAIGWEADVCLGLKRHGRVLFDPLVIVDHRRSPRPGAPPRDAAERYAIDYTRNLFYIAGKHFSGRELLMFLPFMTLAGQRASPGLLRAVTAVLGHGSPGMRLACATARARRVGFRSGLSKRRTSVTVSPCR